MNVELFLKRLNEHSKFRVNINFLNLLVSSNTEKMQQLYKEITIQIPELNINNKKVVKSYLIKGGYQIDKITQTALKELFNQSGDIILDKLAKYYKHDDKVIKIQGFLKNCAEDGEPALIIKPVFGLNSAGGISVSKPSFPFSIYEIKRMLGFTTAINFATLEDIVGFLKKYKDIIIVTPEQANFLILNLTLYLDMIDSFNALTPVELVENKIDIVEDLVNKFHQEFYAVKSIKKYESIGEIYVKARTDS